MKLSPPLTALHLLVLAERPPPMSGGVEALWGLWYVLAMSDLRAPEPSRVRPVARSRSRAPLEALLERERVEPYLDEATGRRKWYRQGGPLEWQSCSPPDYGGIVGMFVVSGEGDRVPWDLVAIVLSPDEAAQIPPVEQLAPPGAPELGGTELAPELAAAVARGALTLAQARAVDPRTLRQVKLAAQRARERGLTAEQLRARPQWHADTFAAALFRTAVRWGLIA